MQDGLRTTDLQPMAFIDGFGHDVFISYAHVDAPDPYHPESWMDRFDAALQIQLEQRLNKLAFSMWRDDRRLMPNFEFDEEIAQSIDSSAVLLVLLSPGYVDSPYCRMELERFVKTAKASSLGLKVDSGSRIFLVKLDELRPDQAQPPVLQTMDGVQLFERDKKNLPRRLRDGDLYQEAVDRLAVQLATFLMQMKQATPTRKVSTRPVAGLTPGSGGPTTVFLGHATSDLEEQREQLAETLTQYGVTVLPDIDPAGLDLDSLTDAIAKHCSAATISFHLTGRRHGEPLYGDELNPTLPVLDYEVAVDTADSRRKSQAELGELDSNAPASVIVWTPGEVIASLGEVDDAQKQFLREIKRQKSASVEWLQQGMENLIDISFKRLGVEREQPTTDAVSDSAYVLVSCKPEAKHHNDFRKILDYLLDHGVDYEFDINSDVSFQEHASLYDGLLILYLESGETWVKARAREASQCIRRRKGLVAGIYDGPPPEKPEFGFESSTVPVYVGRDGFDGHVLDNFLERF